jgi:hypothetical protein
MITSLCLCIGAFVLVLFTLRRDGISLGLPFAYMIQLLLIHVPGAYVHLVNPGLVNTEYVEIGIRYAAWGAVSFAAGVVIIRWIGPRRRLPPITFNRRFALFCLIGGWFFVYALSPLHRISSLGAAVDAAGAIWMLGVLLGVRFTVQRADLQGLVFWMAALMVYPVLMLVLGGFLSYGSAAVIIVMSVLAISLRSRVKLIAGLLIGAYLAMTLFVNYFEHRSHLRKEVWGGAPLSSRVDATLDIFQNFQWFDAGDFEQATAVDARLNQNYFVGLAALRIDEGVTSYLYGHTIWEGLEALVPRVLWPGKPVTAGSGEIVAQMTGLRLNENTSWGVGNIMEFEINFGMAGVVVGLFLLGGVLGWLDKKAAEAERCGDFTTTIFCFLPAVAMINPQGSLVEVFSGSAAALAACFGWRWVWVHFGTRRRRRVPAYEVPRRSTDAKIP